MVLTAARIPLASCCLLDGVVLPHMVVCTPVEIRQQSRPGICDVESTKTKVKSVSSAKIT